MASILFQSQLKRSQQRACLSASTIDEFKVMDYLCKRWYRSYDYSTVHSSHKRTSILRSTSERWTTILQSAECGSRCCTSRS